MKYYFFIACFVLVACGPESDGVLSKEGATDSTNTIVANQVAIKSPEQLTDAKGVLGVFDVPEMLTVALLDSARLRDVASVLATNYGLVEKDIALMKSEVNGSAGAIYYNNDTSNFIFECVVPIKAMPTVKPKYSQIVVLEACHMVVYNYYGEYKELYKAYDEIRGYCKKNNLEQTGQLREFYITDPTTEKDPKNWLTRIMLPVK